MNFHPCGHRILIKAKTAVEEDETFARARALGFEIAKSTVAQQQTGVDTGVVLEVGQTAFKDFGADAWCKVGDTVMFAKHAGKVVQENEDFYVFLNDEDIVGVNPV